VRDLFLAFLSQHDDGAWLRAIDRIDQSVHPVDRVAVRIWFHFYPLALQQLMARPDATTLARQMTLAGTWRLGEQIDVSHRFLFGHQYWPQARKAVLAYVDGSRPPRSLDLGAQIHEIAEQVSNAARVSAAEVTGITAIALRTLQQVGPDLLAASPGQVAPPGAYLGRSADHILETRRRRPGGSWWRMFSDSGRQSLVTLDEREPTARFPIIHSQHLTTAAAADTREYRQRDPRCSEGPIPVHCRSCSCGTCWVGVLAGDEYLSPMDGRERAKLAECGVSDVAGPAPIRLACMTEAAGPVSIVIPPWNGLLGRVLNRVTAQTPSPR
jgi:ferredoxin